MSALPIQIPLPPTLEPGDAQTSPAPRGVGFIPLVEAVRRSGMAMQTLANLCRDKWAAIGLARKEISAVGGKPCWHVREDADGQFARGKSPDAMPFDWSKHTEKQREQVRRRKRLLDAWMETRAELFTHGLNAVEATESFLKSLPGDQEEDVSDRTLHRWHKAYRESGLVGLLDGRLEADGEQNGEGGSFIEELKKLYLSPRHRKVSLCYSMAEEKAVELGWKVPFGLRRAQQLLNSLEEKMVCWHREGPRAYDAKYGKYIQRDHSETASNAIWVGDGHKFDVFVNVGGKIVRPVLVSWLDVGSRYCPGWKIIAGAENSDVILAAWRMGVEACGAPVAVYHDNGEGYDAKILQGVTKAERRAGQRPQLDLGVFERLDVGVVHARPYNAKAKLIERWHSTICERFSKRFATYAGKDTSSKPYDREENIAKGNAPTLEVFTEAFAAWLEADYHHRGHEGDDMQGRTPADVFAEKLKQKRVIPAEVLDLELCPRKRVTVTRNGVEVNGITYEAPELDCRTGKELTVLVNNGDVSRVKVLDEAGRFLCIATSRRRLPDNATKEQVREAMQGVNRDRKRVKAARPAAMRIADDPIDRMHRNAEEKRAAAAVPSPETIRIHRSKLEADLPAIRAAEKAQGKPGVFGGRSLGDLCEAVQDAPRRLSLAELEERIEQKRAVNQ